MKKIVGCFMAMTLLAGLLSGCGNEGTFDFLDNESESSTEQNVVVNPGGETVRESESVPEGESQSGNETVSPTAAEPAKEEERAKDGTLDLTPEEAAMLDPDEGISSVRETTAPEETTGADETTSVEETTCA